MSERKVILNHSAEFDTIDKIKEYFLNTNIVGDALVSLNEETEGIYAYKGMGEIISLGVQGARGAQGNDGTGVNVKPSKDDCKEAGDAYIDENGQYNFGHKDFAPVPPLKDIIGEDAANEVIGFVTARRNFYKFDRAGSDFKALVSLSDSPTSNYAKVVEYWKTQGVDLNINKRELTDDRFWDEEHGISEEAE